MLPSFMRGGAPRSESIINDCRWQSHHNSEYPSAHTGGERSLPSPEVVLAQNQGKPPQIETFPHPGAVLPSPFGHPPHKCGGQGCGANLPGKLEFVGAGDALASPYGRGARRAERALSVSFADSSPIGRAKAGNSTNSNFTLS